MFVSEGWLIKEYLTLFNIVCFLCAECTFSTYLIVDDSVFSTAHLIVCPIL